jgi:hypothetical protein
MQYLMAATRQLTAQLNLEGMATEFINKYAHENIRPISRLESVLLPNT